MDNSIYGQLGFGFVQFFSTHVFYPKQQSHADLAQARGSVAIDWTLCESARAKIKVLVKRILRKHGYPPDLQDEATKLVLQQAELLCNEWAA